MPAPRRRWRAPTLPSSSVSAAPTAIQSFGVDHDRPARGPGRQARRHPLLPGVGDRRRGGAQRRGQGALEAASPSCPAASRVGSVDVDAGAGPAPIHVCGSSTSPAPTRAPRSASRSSSRRLPGPSTSAPWWCGGAAGRPRNHPDHRRLRPPADDARRDPAERALGDGEHGPRRLHPQPDLLRSEADHRQRRPRRWGSSSRLPSAFRSAAAAASTSSPRCARR